LRYPNQEPGDQHTDVKNTAVHSHNPLSSLIIAFLGIPHVVTLHVGPRAPGLIFFVPLKVRQASSDNNFTLVFLNFIIILAQSSFTGMAHSDDSSHVALLSDSLRQLQKEQEATTIVHESLTGQNGGDGVDSGEGTHATSSVMIPRRPLSRDGYGFRKSGISTPLSPLAEPNNVQTSPNGRLDSLVPDPNGLGWPGELSPEILALEF
jgi:hypothetical protein